LNGLVEVPCAITLIGGETYNSYGYLW